MRKADTKNPSPLRNRGFTFMMMEREQGKRGGIFCFRRTILFLLMICCFSLNGLAEVSDALADVLNQPKISGDRKAAEAVNKKGLVFHEAKKYSDAEKHYIESAKLDPSFGTAYFNIACVRALTGDAETSIRFLKAALDLDPGLMGPASNDSDLAQIRGHRGYREVMDSFNPKISQGAGFHVLQGKVYATKECEEPVGNRPGKFGLNCYHSAKISFKNGGVLGVEVAGGDACNFARSSKSGTWRMDKNTLEMKFSYELVKGCTAPGPPIGTVLKVNQVSLRYDTMDEFLAEFRDGDK